jgi:octaprenyl-diphosphate synthase
MRQEPPLALTADLAAYTERAISPLDRLAHLLHEDLNAVEVLLEARAASPAAMIPDVARHLIGAGGKRLRPLITLGAAQLFGPVTPAAHRLAAAVEFIHTATLLHDDVVDDSELRRGKPAARRIWGNSASILVGDFLFAGAFTLMVETGNLAVLDILSRAACVISEGEVRQLAAKAAGVISEEEYLAIAEAKTAALFEAAARAGAISTGASTEAADMAAAYGRNLGLAFQLVDDALDYGGLERSLGKAVGDDFREGKITLPVILAQVRGGATDKAFWSAVLARDAVRDQAALDGAISRIKATGALSSTLDEARRYVAAAKLSLRSLPDGPVRDALEEVADFVVERVT